MNQADFSVVVEDTIKSTNRLLVIKGGEYAGSEDRLANFKRGAALTGCHPLQVLFIYMSKHYDAVSSYTKDMAKGTTRELSEPIDGRLDDIINYCILAKAMIKEIRNEQDCIGKVSSRVTDNWGLPTKQDPSHDLSHNTGRWPYPGRSD